MFPPKDVLANCRHLNYIFGTSRPLGLYFSAKVDDFAKSYQRAPGGAPKSMTVN